MLFQIDTVNPSISALKFIENGESKQMHYVKSTFMTNREMLLLYINYKQLKYMRKYLKCY